MAVRFVDPTELADEPPSRARATKSPATGATLRIKKARSKSDLFGHWAKSIVQLDPKAMVELIREGVDADIIVAAGYYFALKPHEIGRTLGMSQATTERRIKSKSLLSSTETERLARLAVIEAEAEEVFGSPDKARRWLSKPHMKLGEAPISFLDTDVGASEVRKILNAIAYGGVA